MDYEGWKYLCSVGVRSKVQDEANVWTLIPEPSKLSCRGKHNQLRRSPRHSRQDSNTMWKINTDQPQCIPMSGQCEDERRVQRGQLSWAEWTQHAVTPPGVLHPAGVQPQCNGSDVKLDVMIALLTMAWACIPINVCLYVSTYTTESLIHSVQSVSARWLNIPWK